MTDELNDDFFGGEVVPIEPPAASAAVVTPAPEPIAVPPAEPPAVEGIKEGISLADALNGTVPPAEATVTPDPNAPPGAPDPWEPYRDKTNGLIHGRYKTAEEAVAAVAEVDRVRGQLASEIGELRDEMRRMFSGTDLEPQQGDPPRLREACEAAKVLPSKMRSVQAAVDYALNVANWTQEQIDSATPDEWKELRDELRDGIRTVREEQRQEAAQVQVQAKQQEERVFQAFETRHPDLQGRREIVDVMSTRLANQGYRRQGQSPEEFFDLVAEAVRNQLLPVGAVSGQRPVVSPPAPVVPQAPPGYRLVPVAAAPAAPAPAPRTAPVLPGGGVQGGGTGRPAAFVDDGSDFFNA